MQNSDEVNSNVIPQGRNKSKHSEHRKSGGGHMKHQFFDVVLKRKVQREVIAAVKTGKGDRTRYALKAQTEDGRSLTAFVKKEEWEKYKQQL